MFRGNEGTILVDPLLLDEAGHGARWAIYPPRELDLGAFPPVDGVFLTHEHEDHFDPATLHRLDRAIPIHLSARSSRAARQLLAEMGFGVTLVEPGRAVRVRDLEIYPFTPHQKDDTDCEWDVLPFLVRDLDGHGSFFSAVDARPPKIDVVRKHIEKPGIWSLTNNVNNWEFMEIDVIGPIRTAMIVGETPSLPVLETAQDLLDEHLTLLRGWARPCATLLCGSGLSYFADRAWLNRNAFPSSFERICEALRLLDPSHPFLAPKPGQTLAMRAGRLVSVDERTPFLATKAREAWPAREFAPDVWLAKRYEPACGERDLLPERKDALERGLDELARYLYGHVSFRAIYSLEAEQLRGRVPSFALKLLTGKEEGQHLAYGYEPHACGFAPVAGADPVQAYLLGIECWATDLLALFEGTLSPAGITEGRMRTWNANPSAVRIKLTDDVWTFAHPLHRPDTFLKLYRSELAKQPADVPRLRASRIDG
jgi:hypothetical protein